MAITIPQDIVQIYLFYSIGREIGENLLTFTSYLTIVPIGLFSISLPIAPAGIGVGQGVFYNIFIWFGAQSGNLGVSIITIYQLLTIIVNIFFVFVYLKNKKSVDIAIKDSREKVM
jgi:uncharacterized membrane protein YbhN (UPF0104 family)